ncbi:mycofactocin precursor [Dietzia sp. DQ12-76]|nr:mycofactocin precursor [Dietzia sp. DQ12-76]MBB1026724.1 mycofactocin precursor [Dietzia sp. DQ11-38-2]
MIAKPRGIPGTGCAQTIAFGTRCQYDADLTVCGESPNPLTRGIAVDNAQNTEVVLEEALIEEVSIDGMCGVY